MNTTDWYKEKREVFYKLENLNKLVQDEERVMSPEEHQTWNELSQRMEEIQSHIDKLERMKDIRSSLNEPVYDGGGKKVGTVEEREYKYNDALHTWMRFGSTKLDAEQKDILKPVGGGAKEAITLRAAGTLANPAYTQTTGVFGAITEAKKFYGGWFAACEEIQTGAGRQFNYPTVDETSLTGALEAAGTDGFEASDAITLGYKQLDAYIYSSQGVAVGNEDLEDADFDLASAVGTILGTRLWRAIATAAMTGTGSSQPQGLARAAAKGLLTGNCTIDYSRMIQFAKTVDWAYMRSPGSGFMFHQSMFWDIMGLKSSTGQPLWQPSMAAGAPSTFMGVPYWVSNELTATSTVSALSRHMLLGDFKNFKMRYAGPTQLIRLTERYAELFRTGFIALQRFDSELIAANATTYNPVKYLRRIST